jgi:hypothetical protein
MKLLFAASVGASLACTLAGVANGQPVTSKTLQLTKVILDTESKELVARVKGGTLCVFPSNVKIPKEKKTQNYERFDNLFTTKLKSGGFTVISTSNDMFGAEDEKNKGDYLIGVTLRPTTYNLCSSAKGEKGTIAMDAEWQIYDRAAGKVVETVSTSAEGSQDKFAVDGEKQMINSAFTANLGALIEKGLLQKYVQAAPASE